jgi:hypothetical protein
LALPTQAHELRSLGDGYWIQLGGHIEPPYSHVKNGVDVYFYHEDTVLPNPEDSVNASVDLHTDKGDKVNVEVIGLITSSADFKAPITRVFPLNRQWKLSRSKGKDFAHGGAGDGISDLHYQENAFVFNKPTTYGFYAQGTIQRVGFKPKRFAEKFICEAGSQDTTYHTAFECVTDAPKTSPQIPPEVPSRISSER